MKKALVLLLALLFCKALAKPASENAAKESSDDDTVSWEEASNQLNNLADSDGDSDNNDDDDDEATVARDDDLDMEDGNEDEDTDNVDDDDDDWDMGESSVPTTDWEKETLKDFNAKWSEAMKAAEEAGDGNDDETIWAREVDGNNGNDAEQTEPESTKVELTDDIESNQVKLNDAYLTALNTLAEGDEDEDSDDAAQPVENQEDDDDGMADDAGHSDDDSANDDDEDTDDAAEDDQAQDGNEDAVDGDADSAPLEDELTDELKNTDDSDDVDDDQDGEAAAEMEDVAK